MLPTVHIADIHFSSHLISLTIGGVECFAYPQGNGEWIIDPRTCARCGGKVGTLAPWPYSPGCHPYHSL